MRNRPLSCSQRAAARNHCNRSRSPSDAATRIALTVLSRLFDWRDALAVVSPATLIRWHRAGWRLLWRWKSRPGRPPIPLELRKLIRRMAIENPTWGEEGIANELTRVRQLHDRGTKLGAWDGTAFSRTEREPML
jgi:hypothetical protein